MRTSDLQATPSVQEVDRNGPFAMISLKVLVGMKLTSFLRKGQTHLEDMASAGLIDRAWISKYQTVLAKRLAEIPDTPENSQAL